MKKLVCEVCGSNEIVKDGDYFVCQSCGTKYTSEAVKKLFIEGSVSVDRTKEIQNLKDNLGVYINTANWESVQETCKQLLVYDNESVGIKAWSAVSRARIDIQKQVDDMRTQVLPLENEPVGTNIAKASRLGDQIASIYKRYCDIICRHFDSAYELLKELSSKENFAEECHAAVFEIYKMLYVPGEVYEKWEYGLWSRRYTNDKKTYPLYKPLIDSMNVNELSVLRDSLMKYKNVIKSSVVQEANIDRIVDYMQDLISKRGGKRTTESDYSSGGCYVATCVYGSYDCPEVWTLRRFRDYDLAKTWYGRMFICTYYAVSPTIVEWFGQTNWFNSLLKPILDKMVLSLKDKGYKDTPYIDRQWQ